MVSTPKDTSTTTDQSTTLQVSAPASSLQQCLLIGHRLNASTDKVCDRISGGSVIGSTLNSQKIYAFNEGTLSKNTLQRILVLGAIHGDEISAGWLTYQWVSELMYSKKVPNEIALRVLPITNPDSALATSPRRTNSQGVDLNRNFPTKNWAAESNKWWTQTTKKDPRRYPGKTAASELETKLILKEIETFKPTVIVSVHAPFGVLDYDGPGVPPKRIGSLRLDAVGIYPGSLGNYASQIKGIPVVTLELPAAMKATTMSESRRMWQDLIDWLKARPRLVGNVSSPNN